MKNILHITAGSDDWEPTTEDLQIISQLFNKALLEENDSVIATRRGIKLKVVDITETSSIKIINVHVENKQQIDNKL